MMEISFHLLQFVEAQLIYSPMEWSITALSYPQRSEVVGGILFSLHMSVSLSFPHSVSAL